MKKKPDPEQTSNGILENNVCNICSNCFFQVNLAKKLYSIPFKLGVKVLPVRLLEQI